MRCIGGIVMPLDLSFQIIFKTDITSQNQKRIGRYMALEIYEPLVCNLTIFTENLVCIENEKIKKPKTAFF